MVILGRISFLCNPGGQKLPPGSGHLPDSLLVTFTVARCATEFASKSLFGTVTVMPVQSFADATELT